MDTGAEANLVRKGLLSDALMQNAREPLSFVTANGKPLEGGKKTANFTLFFEQVVNGQTLPQNRSFQAEFYEAVIGVDAILSFPWMAQHKVGVFPHHQALALEEPVFTLLFGLRNEGSRGSQHKEKVAVRFTANGSKGISTKSTFLTKNSKSIFCPCKR